LYSQGLVRAGGSWAAEDTSVVTVEPSSGRVTAVGAGRTRVRFSPSALAEGLAGVISGGGETAQHSAVVTVAAVARLQVGLNWCFLRPSANHLN
jgi:hypothetical protein